jgi:uncharacterized protein YhbP (UPF0306 family)
MDDVLGRQIQQVTEILSTGKELVLASIRPDGTPHASTMSYANAGVETYCAISLDSQKAHDIRHDSNVAYVVNAPYRSWAEIRGLSINAKACMLVDPDELALASQLLLKKYPEFATIISSTEVLPWPGMLFIALRPRSISLLDYTHGFGHTEHFSVPIEQSTKPAL